MVRLLQQADHVADPDLFAGLCHACRYCGLLEASIAAYEQALRLNPKARTSIVHTYFVMGDYSRVVLLDDPGAAYIGALAMAQLGRGPEAVAMLRKMTGTVAPRLGEFLEATVAVIEGRGIEDPEVRKTVESAFVDQVSDPEGVYYAARNLAKLGQVELALGAMAKAVDNGYFCYPAFIRDPYLDPLRGHPAFDAAMDRAKERHAEAVAAFKSAGGERIVGVRLS